MPSEDADNLKKKEDQNSAMCRHHWTIEPAYGSVSRGVCQICQEYREFKNSIE